MSKRMPYIIRWLLTDLLGEGKTIETAYSDAFKLKREWPDQYTNKTDYEKTVRLNGNYMDFLKQHRIYK